MKDFIKYAIILGIIATIAATGLAWGYAITQPRIVLQQEKELNDALKIVLPETENGIILCVTDSTGMTYYCAYQNRDTTLITGYAVLAEAKGYSSRIRTLIGVDTLFNINKIKVLSQQETPGLGTRCQEIRSGESTPWWQNQFTGQPGLNVALTVDGGHIQSITGATITSRAITNSISEQIAVLKKRL